MLLCGALVNLIPFSTRTLGPHARAGHQAFKDARLMCKEFLFGQDAGLLEGGKLFQLGRPGEGSDQPADIIALRVLDLPDGIHWFCCMRSPRKTM